MAITESLKGLSEKQIRELAKKYNPNEATNSYGASWADVALGDMYGTLAKQRKNAHDWVEEHDKKEEGIEVDDEILNGIKDKITYLKNLATTFNKSADPLGDAKKAKDMCDEIVKLIVSINPAGCTEEEISELNDATASVNDMKECFKAIEIVYKHIPVKEATIVERATPVQQTVAAHNPEQFNISNFIKPAQQTVAVPNTPVNNVTLPALPHQDKELTTEEITREVEKHFRLIPREQRNYTVDGCALYDLLKNKVLGERMKELNSKQRSNNPFLTHVDINKYINDPELLQKYSLCFTIPCNERDKIIVVLLDPVAKNINGELQYPLNILKMPKAK